MFRLFEINGQWPSDEQAVIVALIPKSDGGLRPIALFRTAYRIYAKAHARKVRDWAALLPDAQCNNSKGRWVGDSTCRAQIRAVTQSKNSTLNFFRMLKKPSSTSGEGLWLGRLSCRITRWCRLWLA